jgi:hypothetical protein
VDTGRLGLNVRLLADENNRRYVTGLVLSVYQFLGYSRLVVDAILALQVLGTVLRTDPT